MNYLQRTKAFLNSSEDDRIKLISDTAMKAWMKAIEIAKRNKETLKRKLDEELSDQETYLSEAKDSYLQAFSNVDVSKKMSLDERKSYVEGAFQQQIAQAATNLEHVENRIKSLKETFEEKTKFQDNIITRYSGYISVMEMEDGKEEAKEA